MMSYRFFADNDIAISVAHLYTMHCFFQPSKTNKQ